uniref:Uncharacterized protein n=1 Tax=Moumouvirus sp. 'Monve' TaxID=1128131 RepID=H2EF73_9VIRU|nr:hypothetical protein mv_R936 [Moumouvirus Monve]
MSQFDLNKFLQNYKPKIIDFTPYLSLKNYGTINVLPKKYRKS